MGLMDILNNLPSTQADPRDQKQGMSPIAMALLALLAYKALTRKGGITGNAGQTNAGQPGGQLSPPPAGNPGGSLGGLLGGLLGGAAAGGAMSGGLGDILGGMLGGNQGNRNAGGLGDILGGMLGGNQQAGGALSGGLGDLLKQLQDAGQGDAADSWVKPGANKAISPNDLGNALGADMIGQLTAQTGMSRNELLSGLAQQLPQFVDQLTPDGRMPTAQEASRWL